MSLLPYFLILIEHYIAVEFWSKMPSSFSVVCSCPWSEVEWGLDFSRGSLLKSSRGLRLYERKNKFVWWLSSNLCSEFEPKKNMLINHLATLILYQTWRRTKSCFPDPDKIIMIWLRYIDSYTSNMTFLKWRSGQR